MGGVPNNSKCIAIQLLEMAANKQPAGSHPPDFSQFLPDTLRHNMFHGLNVYWHLLAYIKRMVVLSQRILSATINLFFDMVAKERTSCFFAARESAHSKSTIDGLPLWWRKLFEKNTASHCKFGRVLAALTSKHA